MLGLPEVFEGRPLAGVLSPALQHERVHALWTQLGVEAVGIQVEAESRGELRKQNCLAQRTTQNSSTVCCVLAT